jgi:hypothetical protein
MSQPIPLFVASCQLLPLLSANKPEGQVQVAVLQLHGSWCTHTDCKRLADVAAQGCIADRCCLCGIANDCARVGPQKP